MFMNCTIKLSRLCGLILACLWKAQLLSIAQTPPFSCGNGLLPGAAVGLTNPLTTLQLKSTAEDTTTYVIPIVFIIYHLGEPIGSGSNVSDADIQYQLNQLNQRYAGQGINYAGQDSKIRFALAHRTPLCNATTGVIRVDASNVPGYQANGYNDYDYTMAQQLEALVPDFRNRSARDGIAIIKVMHRIEGAGNFAITGGSCFLNALTMQLTGPGNQILAHEVGHLLFLAHPYDGSYATGSGTYSCPTDTYNDGVEDTPPVKLYDPPDPPVDICSSQAELLINGCTGQPFGQILRNIMSYGCQQDRFTPGQIARMRYYLANDLKKLGNSGLDQPLIPSEVLAPITCQVSLPQPPVGSYQSSGINYVQFAGIVNSTGSYPGGQYQDYSCTQVARVTAGQSYWLTISGYGTFGRAYIDYNNDGVFDESTELIMAFATNTTNSFQASQQITLPATAVLNQKLRLRIIFDCGPTPPTACALPGDPARGSGEVEDYGITLSTMISGHVFNDLNGLTDNLVNGVSVDGTALPQANGAPVPIFVSLVQSGSVLATAPVLANGSYILTGVSTGSYSLVLTTTPGGSTTPGLPYGWGHTGENIGTGIGNDGWVDGTLPVIVSGSGVIDANFGIKAYSDLTPILIVRPSSVYNATPITVVVIVGELNSVPTTGPITVKIAKDPKFTLSFDPAATAVNGRVVQNSAWSFSGPSGGFYTLTTTNVIASNVGTGTLAFGLTGTLSPGATVGTLTVSAIILGGSGGQTRIDNDTDADKIEYFAQ